MGTVLALFLAFRRPGGIQTLAVSIVMLVVAFALAYLVNRAAWSPLINLMLDLVDPGREIPRRN